MDNLEVTTELGRLFSAFSEIYFITPTQFVIHCKEFLSLFHRVATSHHQQSRILDVLEVAISAFQISVLPATMSMEIFQPDLDTPESSKIMDHLMATAEKIVYSSYGCLDLHIRMATLANVYAEFVPVIPKPETIVPRSRVRPNAGLDLNFDFRTPPPITPTRTAKTIPIAVSKQLSDESYESESGKQSSMSPMSIALPAHSDSLESLFTLNDGPHYFLELPTSTSAHILNPSLNPSGTEESLSTSLSILELPWSSRTDGQDSTMKEPVADEVAEMMLCVSDGTGEQYTMNI